MISDCFTNKSEYFMLLGKVLNVTSDYDAKAEEHLAKAVKLDPKLVEAWNQLGEAFWKKGNISGAKNCFAGALTHVSMISIYLQLSKYWKISVFALKIVIIFLTVSLNICFGLSKEPSHWDISFDNPQP